MSPFRDIRFGYASAEAESANDPQLLLKGFWDIGDIFNQAVSGNRFLFLGYKGSGKSAIAEHLRLRAEGECDLFATTTYLSDFPYSDFKKIVSGDAAPETRYPTAWSWLLLLKIISSMAKDHGSRRSTELEIAIGSLQKAGLLPADDLRQLVLTSSKKSFKGQIPKLLEGQIEFTYQGQDLEIYQITQYLKRS